MKIGPVIERLRAEVGAFNQRVFGAADFSRAFEQDDVAVPCAFVIPLGELADEDRTAGAVSQDIDEQIAVAVCLDNSDLRGQAASEAVEDIRLALWTALLGWRAPDMDTGFEYRAGELLDLTRARIWFQFTFAAQRGIQEV